MMLALVIESGETGRAIPDLVVDDATGPIPMLADVPCQTTAVRLALAAPVVAALNARLAEPLGCVRAAMDRLRGELARARDCCDGRNAELVELALADVIRVLVRVRRSLQVMIVDLAELTADQREGT